MTTHTRRRRRKPPPKPKALISQSAPPPTALARITPIHNNQFETIAEGSVVAIFRLSWMVVSRRKS